MSLNLSSTASVNTSDVIFNSTIISGLNNTSTTPWQFNSNSTLNTTFFPWIVVTPPNIVITTNDTFYYTYSFYVYFIIFLIVMLSLISAKAIQRRNALARQAAIRRARASSATGVSSVNNNSGFQTPPSPKDSDLPPTYHEVMQAQLNVKELIRSAEEGAITPQHCPPPTYETTVITYIDNNHQN